MTSELIMLGVALLLSAYFSGTETAYTSSGRLALEVYTRHKRPGAKIAMGLFNSPILLFSTTLVGNNLVGVVYSSIAALLLARWGLPIQGIVLISSVVILVFGEILPKSLARERSEVWAMNSGWLLRIAYVILFPFVWIARAASGLLLLVFGFHSNQTRNAAITMGELRGVWGDLQKAGTLDDEEAEMLDHAVSLREKSIGELMVPRTSMISLPTTATTEEATKLVQGSGFSRIPVYRKSIDHVVGILHAKRLLENPSNLEEILMEPVFVPEQASVPKFLQIAREEEVSIAIVIDEHGGVAGLVSLEDVVEELFGNIEDEFDHRNDLGRSVSADSWVVPGRATLPDLKDRFGIDLPTSDFESVGGLMIEKLGKIPELGDTVVAGRWILRVVAADLNRVKRVLIRKGVSRK